MHLCYLGRMAGRVRYVPSIPVGIINQPMSIAQDRFRIGNYWQDSK